MPSFIQGHALIIGVGSYQHELRLNVPITAADARALATVLHDPQYCGYPAAQVRLLSDSNASRVGILAALDDMVAHTQPTDTALIFYNGHGERSALHQRKSHLQMGLCRLVKQVFTLMTVPLAGAFSSSPGSRHDCTKNGR